jgi:hypothetical protein
MTNPNNHPQPTRHDGVFESGRSGHTPKVQHNSGNMRSTPAGGEVPVSQYTKKVPQPVPPPPANPGTTNDIPEHWRK